MAPPPPPRRAPTLSAADAMRSMLLEAAHDGDLLTFNKMVRLLDKGRGRLRETVEAVTMDTDEEELKGIGALHLAASNGKLEMCRYLVEGLRVDVDIVDCAGRTPLINAVQGESVEIVKYLLEHGANQDKVDRNGFAPLHSAAGLGCCEIVELLLARGAYTDPVTCCGTPLHIAATEGQDCTMKILLDHNADYNKMINGMTPLYFAISAASVKCVELLVQAGAVANGDYFFTALSDAPKNVSSECLNCVLGVGLGSSWHATNDNEPVDKMKVAELKSQGNKAVGRKDFLRAAEFYSMALGLDPEDATLFSNRSLCWLHMGKPLLSLMDALECRKKRPDWPKACYRQGIAQMSLKDYKGACESLLDALKLDPGSSELEDALRYDISSFNSRL
ncbi:hypothetical protein HU200_041812 [Digitaria exilis]|uniref:Uncharacterized protein n=1 Tax=Digitaria exilis TaxID=1010633 RepID=A0A835EIV7_9POAL|nr:hypothetical protein HU200_041812 [Digitaria exilis]